MDERDIVEIEGLWTKFGDHVVHRGVDLGVRRGEVMALVGGSGSGKTTLLRQMLGLEWPARGSVRVFGHDLHRADSEALNAVRSRWGVLFQHGALFSALSVFENVALPLRELRALGEPVIRDLAMLKLAMVGIEARHAHKMPAELSGGMIKRVGLARAIALDPMLIMYDEPFAGLDPVSCAVVGNLIRKLNDALGATSIVVSYDAAETLKVIDYLYLIAEGVVGAQGPTEEMRVSKDPFVRQFLRGEPDGPVPFHYPAAPYASEVLARA